MDAHADTADVVAARDGDREALARLLAGHLPLVYNVVGRALHGHPDVDDVVQETMLRAVQALPALREPERFRSWLLAIAVRQIQDRARTRRGELVRAHPAGELPDPPDPDAEFADDAVTRLRLADERRIVLEAGRWLDADDRRVLALWWQEIAGGLTRAEVAAALGLTVAHTGVRIQRMRAHLLRARAVLAAWRARPRCAGLTAVARGWDGSAEPRWQKRLHRHITDCPRCQAVSRPPIATETILAGTGLLPVSAGLLEGLLHAVATSAAPGGAATALAATGWWSTLLKPLAAKPALTAGTAAGTAAAIAVVVVLLPGQPSSDGGAVAAPPSPSTPAATAPAAPPSASVSPSVTAAAARTQLFLSPTGSDDGDGSAARPYASLAKAVSVVRPGQTIVAGGGTYRAVDPVVIATDGTAQQRITLTNAPGERPVFDAADLRANTWFITQTADHWTVRGLEIRNAPRDAYVCRACRQGVFDRLSIHDNGGTGLTLRDPGTAGNQVLNSDFYRNHDAGAAADGLSLKYGAGTGNIVRGCRVWGNVDDGFDLHEFTDPVTIDRSWAYGNGIDHWRDPGVAVTGAGNGFRLGGGNPAPAVPHVVTNSAAWDNTGYGFTESANRGTLRLTSNTAYRNGKEGFAFFYSSSVFRANLALGNAREARLSADAVQDGNSWNQSGWTADALVEDDPAGAQRARPGDGRLPATAFLTNDRDPALGAPMTG
ncbi:sigma-70 family RNA polymerase sigma factor [Catellatospora sp. NPDC049609]|uniref:sigma-70 family RNA polymerase sigma factor n=1 Tax=Catellatospora sp. NPDC049609 TaxID=3155505 RepID=UPI0034307C81